MKKKIKVKLKKNGEPKNGGGKREGSGAKPVLPVPSKYIWIKVPIGSENELKAEFKSLVLLKIESLKQK